MQTQITRSLIAPTHKDSKGALLASETDLQTSKFLKDKFTKMPAKEKQKVPVFQERTMEILQTDPRSWLLHLPSLPEALISPNYLITVSRERSLQI